MRETSPRRRRAAMTVVALTLLSMLVPAAASAVTQTPIMSSPRLTEAELLRWFDARKPARVCNQLSGGSCTQTVTYRFRAGGDPSTTTPAGLISRYYSEGRLQGVAPDVAFIQATLETAWFFFPDYGQVRPHHSNFAGMGAFDNSGGAYVFNFPGVATGVRAHQQHLRAYADSSTNAQGTNLGTPLAEDVDKRYPDRWRLVRGMSTAKATTWEGMGNGVWATDPNYSCKILNLYRDALDMAGKPSGGLPTSSDCTRTWHLRFQNSGGGANATAKLGRPGDRFLACDWNGDGKDTPAAFQDGRWILSNQRDGSGARVSFTYGGRGDLPLCGDWNGNGIDTVGIVRGGEWHLRNNNSGGNSNISFTYGQVTRGDVPIVGDWNGNRVDTPGIIRDGEWHLRNSHSGGNANVSFTFGRITRGDRPLIGDWNGNGRDTIGIVRDRTWHLRNALAGGSADHSFIFGRVAAGDSPLMGDWTGDGVDTPAIVR